MTEVKTNEKPEHKGIEPGSLDQAPDPYKDFNEVQLRSTLKAKDKELERLKGIRADELREHGTDIDHYKKKIGKLESSMSELSKTIGTQHDTLNNREAVVDELRELAESQEETILNLEHANGSLRAELENATEPQPGGAANAIAGGIEFYAITTALQAYAVRVAREATETQSALTAVHLIQLAGNMEALGDWERVNSWLITGQ